MRTVVRFHHRSDDREVLLALGRAMNTAWPGVFEDRDVRTRRVGFSLDVADSADWQDHVDGTIDFLETCAEMFARATKIDISIVFDTAIWPEDRAAQGQIRLTFSPRLMAAFAATGAHFFVSDYVGPDEGRPSPDGD